VPAAVGQAALRLAFLDVEIGRLDGAERIGMAHQHDMAAAAQQRPSGLGRLGGQGEKDQCEGGEYPDHAPSCRTAELWI
jgi:hypothetical protein